MLQNLHPEEELALTELKEGHVSSVGLELGKIFSSVPQNKTVIDSLKVEYPDAWVEVQKRYGSQKAYATSLDARFIYFAFFEQGRDLAYKHSPTTEIISKIHSAGGVVLYSPEGSFDELLFDELKKTGVDGIMGWHATKLGMHPSLKEGSKSHVDIQARLLAQAHKEGLLVLGGSDAQGKTFVSGVGIGDMFISVKRADELEKRINQIRENNLATFLVVAI